MIIFNFVFQIFGLLIFAITFLIALVPLSILLMPFKRKTRFKFLAPCWMFTFKVIIKVTTFGRVLEIDRREESIKEKISPPGLFIANHQSFMDIPLISNYFVIAPIMKKSLLYLPVLGLCLWASGGIIVDRKKRNSRKKALLVAQKRLLTDEKNMMYYPEGSRNRKSNSPKEFKDIKTPILKFAFDNNITVYPVSMYGTNQMVKKKMIQYGKKIGIILHAGLKPSDYTSQEEFCRASWECVRSGHQELTEKLARE